MFGFSKVQDKKPFGYTTLEMRKSPSKLGWLAIASLGLVTLVIFLFSTKEGLSPTITIQPSPTISQASPSASITPTLGKITKTSNCVSVNGLPDRECTPGAIDPKVTQDNIQQTICVSGYTKTVRPPSSYTNDLKIKQIQEYNYSDTNIKDYEEDHLISLELGGNPTSEANLWPEPYYITLNAKEKDKVENYLHDQICSRKITLQQAQLQIANNWEEVFNRISH